MYVGVVVVCIIAGFFAYSYFFPGAGSTSTTLQPAGYSGALGSAGTTTSLTGREFVRTLENLKQLSLDSSIFKDSAFLGLEYMGVRIEPQEYGRPNPFAPLTAVTQQVF